MSNKRNIWKHRGVEVRPSECGRFWLVDSNGAPFECANKAQARIAVEGVLRARKELEESKEAASALVKRAMADDHPFLDDPLWLPGMYQ